MTKIVISGTGLFTPEHSISNEELVTTFNTYVENYNTAHAAEISSGETKALLPSSTEFVEKASGIKSRYVMNKEGILDPARMAPDIPERTDQELSILAEMAVMAAKDAMSAAHKHASEVDAVIIACSNLQRAYPAIAVEVQDALGIEGFGFDMNVACSSATFGIQVAADMIRAGSARAILVVNPEICSAHLNFRDRDSHFIFGDVATALLLETDETIQTPDAFEIISSKLTTQFSNNIRNNFGFLNNAAPKGIGSRDKLFVQEGRKVFKDVVPMVANLILDHLKESNIPPSQLRRLWLHQANIHMNDFIGRKVLGHDPAPSEAPNILDEYANTSSAGSIIAFHKNKSDFTPGDIGLICSFGAGYSAGSVIIRKMG